MAVGGLPDLGLKPIQSQIDQGVEGFVGQASNAKTLAALMAGGFAYRFTRVGLMSGGAGLSGVFPLRAASIFFGFGAEVGSFEFTQRLLSGEENAHRWNWNGVSGWKEGLTHSALTFGLLKAAGFLARDQNLILRHLFQSSALVAGHQAAHGLGIAPRPEGGFAEQLINAETTNLQMSAGMALLHGVLPRMIALERSLDFSLTNLERFSNSIGANSLFKRGQVVRWGMTGAGGLPVSSLHPDRAGSVSDALLMMAVYEKAEGGRTPGPSQKGLWFPIRNTQKIPLEVEYSGEVEKQIGELEKQMRRSRLRLERVSSRQDLLTIRSDENLVNTVWWHQLRSFARALGVEPKEFTQPEPLLAPLKEDLPARRPEVLREAVRLLEKEEGLGVDAFRVIELEIPYPDVIFGDPKRPKESTGLIYIQESIEGELGNAVRLGEIDKRAGKMKVRFMSPSLMERILQVVHGPEAPLFFFVEGEVPQALSMKLKALGASPIGISRTSLRLGDRKVRVPPWFFTLHDLFHASMITKFPKTLRELIGHIYFLAKGDSRLRSSPFLKEHLDRLSDMDPPIEEEGKTATFFSYTLGHLVRRYAEDKESDRLTMRRILQYRHFLKSYSELLKAYVPSDPRWESWRKDFSGEIGKLLENFDRMIHRIGKAYTDFLKQK